MPSLGRCLMAVVVVATGCNRPENASAPVESPAARGLYIVNIGGCNDCHTPKIMTANGPGLDSTRLLSGFPATSRVAAIPAGLPNVTGWAALSNADATAWGGPWGISYSANLTPDATGLAAWTPELFIATMRTGKHMGNGRAVLPPMPWYDYALMTDDDLRAVFAYLRTLKPVANQVPPPGPVPPKR